MNVKACDSLKRKSDASLSDANLSRVHSNLLKRNSLDDFAQGCLLQTSSAQSNSLFRRNTLFDVGLSPFWMLQEMGRQPSSPHGPMGMSHLALRNSDKSSVLLVKSDSGDNRAEIFFGSKKFGGQNEMNNWEKGYPTTESDYLPEKKPNTISPMQVAEITYNTIERKKLDMQDIKFFDLFQKAFLSNILCIFAKGKTYIDPNQSCQEFARKATELLRAHDLKATDSQESRGSKVTRKDNTLRWIYKHFICYLLEDETTYTSDKNHRREDYTGFLVKNYFKNDQSFKSDLDRTEFASKRKLLKLFKASPKFKEKFEIFVEHHLRREVKKDGIHKYELIYHETMKRLEDSSKLTRSQVLSTARRLHDLEADVEAAIRLFETIVKK